MSDQPDSSTPKTDRVVRVFISSTFKDMHAEREELVKFTFPELRKRCRERRVEFVGIDLRWGIPDEKKAEGQVLPICLAEIRRCHPFFIGLLGEHYGWVPEEIDPNILKTQGWLTDYKEHSITALEIFYGVLKDPEMKSLAYFYFRNPEKSKKIEEELAKDRDYIPEPQISRSKLQSLKEKIRLSCYSIRDNYPDAKTCGQMVLEDLWSAIDRKFPIPDVPSVLELQRMGHEAFADARRKIYIERKEYYNCLNEHVAGNGLPLVILGESGSGKSALIANWAKRYQEEHPDDFMIIHYIGGTADSADYTRIIRRIMEEIREKFEPEKKGAPIEPSIAGEKEGEAIPTDNVKLIEQFPLWLAKTTGKGRFILILDALNQLEDWDNAPDLGWLPTYFPPHISVILSTLPGRSYTALEKRNWPTLTIKPFTVDEKKVFIADYLKQYAQELSPSLIEHIAQADQTVKPLFLRTLLEELHIYGDHHTLSQKINHYLSARTTDDLYKMILERWEQVYEEDRPGLVKETMSLIWAARRGLSETELLEILNIPRAYWSPLFLAAEESLVSRAGLLTFFHDFLKKAVESQYLRSPAKKRKAHLTVADYFDKKTLDARKVDELPWQLLYAQEWKGLKDCIGNLDMFLQLMGEPQKYELLGYWHHLSDKYDIVDVYQKALQSYEKTTPLDVDIATRLHYIAKFLNIDAHFEAAELFYQRALNLREKALGNDHEDTIGNLNDFALMLFDKGDYDNAEDFVRRALVGWKRLLGPKHPYVAVSLNDLACLIGSKGNYKESESMLRESLLIYEDVSGSNHPDTALNLNNLAFVLFCEGDYEGAEPLFRRALAIREKVLGPEHPDTAVSLKSLASLLNAKGDYEGAESLFRRALAIWEKVLGPEHPNTAASLSGLAELLRAKGDYERAEPLFRRVLAIEEKVLGPEHPNTAASLNNLADLLCAKGDDEGAEPLFRRALVIDEKVLGLEHPDTAASLNGLAVLLDHKGDYEGAEPLFRRALAIREKALGPDHPYTAQSLNNLAGLFFAKGDYEGAEPLYRRALAIEEKVLGPEHPNTAMSLKNLASLLNAKGDYEEAESLFRRALAIGEKVLGPEHHNTAAILSGLASLLHVKGDYEGAEPLFRRALAINEKVLGSDHPDTAASLSGLAYLLHVKGDYEGAESLFRRSLDIRKKVLGPDHPDNAADLNNLAYLLNAKGDYKGAETLYSRSLAIFEKVFGPNHPSTAFSLNNLAMLLHARGDYEGAEPLFRRSLIIREKVLGPDHPDTASSLNNVVKLALALRDKGDHLQSSVLFTDLIETFKNKKVTNQAIFKSLALCYNELAFHTEVPATNWKEAEYHYKKAIEFFSKIPDQTEAANAELNLQTMYGLSGQKVDLERVKELTGILEKVGSPKAEKGKNLLKDAIE